MDSTFNTLAIILKREPWKENDCLITAYSENEGKIKLIARGAKKIKSKSSGHIEPLILSRLMVVCGKKDFDYIGTAIGEEFYSNIRKDEQKIYLALKALNLVEKMTREGEVDGQMEVFNLLKSFLDELNNSVIPHPPCHCEERSDEAISVKQDYSLGFVHSDRKNNRVIPTREPLACPVGREYSLNIKVFSQKLASILGFSREDFEELRLK